MAVARKNCVTLCIIVASLLLCGIIGIAGLVPCATLPGKSCKDTCACNIPEDCSGVCTTTQTQTCFSELATAISINNSTKLIKDLDIGDAILSVDFTGRTFFDTIFRVAHYEPDLLVSDNKTRVPLRPHY